MRPIFFFVICGFASSALAVDIDARRRELRSAHDDLYRQSVVTHADGRKTFGQATLFKREGINVLHLKGTNFEMAFQHGALLRDEILNGAVVLSAQSLKNKVREKLGDRPTIVNIATEHYHRNYTQRMYEFAIGFVNQNGSENPLDDAIGISESTGININELIRATFFPEVLMVIANEQVSDNPLMLRPDAGQCSDFVVWDDYTENGEILIGRNTDYAMNGAFDRFPTVIYFEPNGHQKYMTVVSSGIHNAGLVSLNESGIFLGVHTIPTTNTSVEAIPAFMIANRVIREATTFDQVVELFRRFPIPGGWSYTVVSKAEGRVATLEINYGGVSIRESTAGVHIQTNRYATPEKVGEELFINRSVDDDSDARYNRIAQLLTELRGSMNAENSARILGDHVDPVSGAVRSFPNTVSVHTTITSAIFDLGAGKVYVGNGMAPTSESTYVALPTVENFNLATFSTTPSETIVNDQFASNHPDLSASLQHFIDAKTAYEYRFDLTQSSASLRLALDLDPNHSGMHFIAALIALRRDDLTAGKNHLMAMTNDPFLSPHKRLLSEYYQGRVAAEMRDFAVARDKFRFVQNNPEVGEKLRQAAANSLRRVSGRSPRLNLNDSMLMVMFQQADAVAYE